MSSIYTNQNAEIEKKYWVKCCVCNMKTHEGIKQTRIYVTEKKKPVSMSLYMCERCFSRGEAWPGIKPHSHMSDGKIQGELNRFRDNTIINEE